MKNTKSFLTNAEAKALGLPSTEEQIARHNAIMRRIHNAECSHQNVGTVDDPTKYSCVDCGAIIPRNLGAISGEVR
jgi:hypothetical protein